MTTETETATATEATDQRLPGKTAEERKAEIFAGLNLLNMQSRCSAIERLRKQKKECESKFRESGLSAGNEWALSAFYIELKRLYDWWQSQSEHDIGGYFSTNDGDHWHSSHRISDIIAGDDDQSCDEVEEFWKMVCDDAYKDLWNEDEFVRGFTEAAVDFFEGVKDEL